jgi:hypothetical protein
MGCITLLNIITVQVAASTVNLIPGLTLEDNVCGCGGILASMKYLI